MALDNIFKINFPYGMLKDEKGNWTFFNRGYHPLSKTKSNLEDNTNEFSFTKYKGLTEKLLLEIADRFEKGSDDKINKIWFYNTTTNPINSNKNDDWEKYFTIIKKLGKLKI